VAKRTTRKTLPHDTWRATPNAPAWDENRTTILDAAAQAVRTSGLLRLRIDDVAARAGCSRATLYRYFANKDALLAALLARKAAALAVRIEAKLLHLDDPAELVAEGILGAVEVIRRDPWFRSIANDPGSAARVARLAGGPQELARSLAPFVAPLLKATMQHHGHGLRDDIDAAEAAEWMLLVVIGMLTMNLPLRRSRTEQASYLRRFVAYTLLGPPPLT
jgi:AcrR family transcriptional regulator